MGLADGYFPVLTVERPGVRYMIPRKASCNMTLQCITVGHSIHYSVMFLFGSGNGSPAAKNIVVGLLLGTCCCYQIFNELKLFHFATDRN